MMLLRTLVLERGGQDAPVNGALLCGFAVAQTQSNYLAYSLDEELEPGSSRVYIAMLRKKLERYFLSGVDSREDLQVAMQVFKHILMVAAGSGGKAGGVEPPVPYHFIDLKGCKLPPARPEDHHSVIIKKALVMKVVTLGMSAPVLPAIESASLIVPSIRFSSQMTAATKDASAPESAPQQPPALPTEEAPQPADVATAPFVEPKNIAQMDQAVLVEVDSTLSSLARVAQELTQQKLAITERESMLEQWQARLQQEQSHVENGAREQEQRAAELDAQALAINQKAQELARMTTQLSQLQLSLRSVLGELDQSLQA
ncbi:hypothetical protein [Pseudomonas sp. BIGb0164]|uniref:hypothetical protein n=1 Tax=Pseudomonas sp. BIGb0164 TaxID=2940605 RepID=UPI002166FC64|nr:hypothetical protein [Pseudomonas sp. BIGb0164]MCS4249253.1 hypothetical protein [Pseudomonas sp. BIGb0164]